MAMDLAPNLTSLSSPIAFSMALKAECHSPKSSLLVTAYLDLHESTCKNYALPTARRLMARVTHSPDTCQVWMCVDRGDMSACASGT